ncbi:xanthine dehydrogenase accessory factor [Isoptericola jiangsuensis]|uniref:Xanthine dehydrogenase accessory factor n=1 Tax=Isoptericola jiangsuensis TaxID=548579 RepID=A0A2A9EWD8_9MICO|nr:XdhC/CoxI family protein [Isoptericola jiangsuensis]PFG42612.1 xanthine dehydrogenase accessory factor [Isoptericola jiangsuensis]
MLKSALELLPLVRSGNPVAAVTITRVSSSAPHGVGTAMAVTGDGAVVGSISGGCVEGEAVVLGRIAATTGRAATARFGFDDATAHAAGLACGGQVEVVAHRLDPEDALTTDALERAAADRAAALGIVTSGPDVGRVVDVDALRAGPADDLLPQDAAAALESSFVDRESVLLPGALDGADLLVLQHAPRARLILLGAGEHAAALCRVGAAAGFAVTVCDPWETLVTPERFPAADRLVTAVPADHLASLGPEDTDARTAVCVLTHDERLDVPAIRAALAMPVGFVGAMGARRTVAHRAAQLRAAGVAEVDLARLHSPLGLDLGGVTPEETAVSVLAEIVASRRGGSGVPLRERTGRIHRDVGTAPACTTAEPGRAAPAASTVRTTSTTRTEGARS